MMKYVEYSHEYSALFFPWWSVLLIAILAVDGPRTIGFKGNLGLHATLCTNNLVHFSGWSIKASSWSAWSVLLITFLAVDGPCAIWLERDFGLLTTLSTNNLVHFPGRPTKVHSF